MNDTPHVKLYAQARASYAEALDQIWEGEFGKDFKDGQIGGLSPPPNMTADEFDEAEQVLYKILDKLLPAFQGWKTHHFRKILQTKNRRVVQRPSL